jgi:glucose/arabinose dehydrogenase
MRHMRHEVRRRAQLLVASALIVPAAHAASTCYEQKCSDPCGSSWSGFATLVDGDDYPDGADTPVAFVDPDDGLRQRLIATKEGKIWVWDGATGAILATPYLDLSAKVEDNGERGLLALTVDPEFATTGELYVLYTRASGVDADEGDLVVERYTRLTDQTADPTSAETILLLDHSSADNHNGGWLAFGPDRMLYVSFGDGGGSCDDNFDGTPRAPNGQNLDTLLGKLLRLDVRAEDPGATAPECGEVAGDFGVPLGNPFGGATAGCGEIWAYGLRNPWRFSFDRLTGDLWLGDVGQNDWEEINFLAADYYPLAPEGAINYGWKCREGCESLASGCSSADCPAGIVAGEGVCGFPRNVVPEPGEVLYWDPLLCHENNNDGIIPREWRAIVGGYRYRGAGVPSLFGRYLYGDTFCGQLWRSEEVVPGDPAATTAACWDSLPGGTLLYSFAEDSQGELYLLQADGSIVCVHDGDGCPWADGSRIFADGLERGDTGAWSAEVDEP